MIKKWLGKIRLMSSTRFQQTIDEAVDKAVTQIRTNLKWDNSKPQNPEDELSTRSYLYEDKPQYKLNPQDFGLKKDTKINEALTNYLQDSFLINPASIRLQSRDELFIMQDSAVAKYLSDPHATSIVNNIRYYTIGSGVYVKAPDPKVQDVIRKFNQNNRMDRRSKRMVQMGYLKGEYFMPLFVNPKTGDVYVRSIPPSEVTEVETDPQDMETNTAYHRQTLITNTQSASSISFKPIDKWYTDLDYFLRSSNGEPISPSPHSDLTEPNVYMMFVKYGLEDEIRGRVPMFPILRFLKYYEDFLVDRIRINHERSKVVWIKSITGRSTEALIKDRKSPKGGTMLVENENVKYRIEAAKLESADAERDGLLILYHIGSGVNLPLHVLDQRADQAVYASIKKSDSPFTQMIMDHQDFWYNHFELLYRAQIKFKIKAGQLPKTTKIDSHLLESQVAAAQFINTAVVEKKLSNDEIIDEAKKIMDQGKSSTDVPTEEIPLDIIFPDVVSENLLEQAQVLQIHANIGIASRATLSSKAGYNWQMELRNLMSEMETFAPPEPPGGTSGTRPTPKNDRTNVSAPKTNKN
jgi:hypothetical protein